MSVRLDDPASLLCRKFDHDQVNNLLVDRAMGPIQQAPARDYEPALALGDRVLAGLAGRPDARPARPVGCQKSGLGR